MKYPPNKNIIIENKNSDRELVDILSNYFKQRGAFLAQIIKADLISSNYLKRENILD